MLLLAISLFFTEPAPLDMPRATAFLVEEDGVRRLEDRFDQMDLWLTQTIIGRWVDEDDRVFTLASLVCEPPSADAEGTATRAEHAARRVPLKRVRANGGFPTAFRRSVALLSDCALCTDKPRSSRQLPHGYRDVTYWQHPTNYASVVCAFRREKSERWYLAVWHLAENDDYAERMQVFEDQFLRKEFEEFIQHRDAEMSRDASVLKKERLSERELLREDARHSVAAYSDWHFTDAEEFVVLDDLPSRTAVTQLTNEFTTMRARYAAALPTPIDGSNVLCVARLYASRAEYLNALEVEGNTNLSWSAAYWSPLRRELVAYLPEGGADELMKTFRHEAFHQYLSYAASMISTSPWLNEGYAQFFEDVEDETWGEPFDVSEEGLARLAKLIPGLLFMDYDQFYDGTDLERRLKYRLAWSIAVFLEKRAEKVRFRPFAKLKNDYFEALFETRDRRRATSAAFRNEDTLKLFVAEWQKFWKNR